MGSYFDAHLNSNIEWFLQSQKESYAKKAFYNQCFTYLYQNKKSLIHTHMYIYIYIYTYIYIYPILHLNYFS